MVAIDDKTKLDDLTAILHMALGLEVWFPDNNGSFAYGTRLCEEIGELAEVIYETDSQTLAADDRAHLVKEIEDVLQIVMAVLNLFNALDGFPKTIRDFPPVNQVIHDYPALLAIRAGEFANAINHAEGTGIKKEKHGAETHARLVEKAHRLVQTVTDIITTYGIESHLEEQVVKDYLYLRERGFIRP